MENSDEMRKVLRFLFKSLELFSAMVSLLPILSLGSRTWPEIQMAWPYFNACAGQVPQVEESANHFHSNGRKLWAEPVGFAFLVRETQMPNLACSWSIIWHSKRTIFSLGARTLLGAKGIATRNKDATRGSWPYY